MTIEAIIGKGVNRARAICDHCGRDDVLTCDYEGRPERSRPNEGQILRKLQGRGWALVRGVLYCPACEAKRKAVPGYPAGAPIDEKEVNMPVKVADKSRVAASQPLRQPTQDQRGDIIEMLVASYDRKAKRYIGKDTDKTIAEAVGGGCLPGWVAEIREGNFGPAGGNEEIDAVREEITALRSDFDQKVGVLAKRLDAICAAVGPKAARV